MKRRRQTPALIVRPATGPGVRRSQQQAGAAEGTIAPSAAPTSSGLAKFIPNDPSGILPRTA